MLIFAFLCSCRAIGAAASSMEPVKRLAIGSCHSQLRTGMFNMMRAFHPDQLVLLGDNVYVDTRKWIGFTPAEPDEIRRQYCALNGDLGLQHLVRQMGGFDSVFATWDDHDYGINNGDSTYVHKNESKHAFLDFFRVPLHSSRRNRDGVYHSTYHSIQSGSQTYVYKIILLDTRYNLISQKNGDRVPDMLGEVQWRWLEGELGDPDVDIIFLGSSVQILPTDKLILESWHFHDPIGRERLLALISNAPCPNVILLSGDIHEAEISQVKGCIILFTVLYFPLLTFTCFIIVL